MTQVLANYQILKQGLCASLLLLMCGCSLLPELGKEEGDATSTLQQAIDDRAVEDKLDDHMSEWEEVKPSIERLVALEADLKFLIGELSKSETLQENPVDPRDPVVEEAQDAVPENQVLATAPLAAADGSAPASEVSTQALPSVNGSGQVNTAGGAGFPERFNDDFSDCEPAPLNLIGKGIGIHVVSYTNLKFAREGWRQLQGKHRAVFCNRLPLVEEVIVRDRRYYSVRIGPWANHKAARSACMELQKKGQYCALATYEGVPL